MKHVSRPVLRLYSGVISLFLLALLRAPVMLAQTAPPPSDPHEMVTRQPRILSKPAERSAAIDLLERARQNYYLRDIDTPCTLKASFTTNGTSQFEGEGTMDEYEASGQSQWRWVAQLQDSLIIRIGTDGHVYGTNASEPVPLRVQMLRSALHWPIVRRAGGSMIREAEVEHDGVPVTCLLLSGSVPQNPAPRSWVESEYCIDPATGRLEMWSDAPGIYVLYDYNGSQEFHGHTLPRQISIFEEGRLALHAQVESLEDARELDPSLFKPTPEMTEAGGSFTLSGPERFPMRVDPSDGPTSTYFQSVIVHATLDAQDGSVLDAETLQNTDPNLSRAAMELVKSTTFPPSGFQQEAFINVQFHMPAMEEGGPPLFHSPVPWVIVEPRRKATTRKPIPHAGN